MLHDINRLKVVEEFPLDISNNAAFTFSNNVAKTVTNFTHGIHTYPAKFIPHIPRWAFKYAKIKAWGIVLDPLCGCGTLLLYIKHLIVMYLNGHDFDELWG